MFAHAYYIEGREADPASAIPQPPHSPAVSHTCGASTRARPPAERARRARRRCARNVGSGLPRARDPGARRTDHRRLGGGGRVEKHVSVEQPAGAAAAQAAGGQGTGEVREGARHRGTHARRLHRDAEGSPARRRDQAGDPRTGLGRHARGGLKLLRNAQEPIRRAGAPRPEDRAARQRSRSAQAQARNRLRQELRRRREEASACSSRSTARTA